MKRQSNNRKYIKRTEGSLCSLTDEAISVLKTYPAIIATENHAYGRTDADHYAVYGLIIDVKIQDNGIKVYYQILNWIPQQKINELRFELESQAVVERMN